MMNSVEKIKIINRVNEIEKLLEILDPTNVFEQKMLASLHGEIRDTLSYLNINLRKDRSSKFRLLKGGNVSTNKVQKH